MSGERTSGIYRLNTVCKLPDNSFFLIVRMYILNEMVFDTYTPATRLFYLSLVNA
jgi:hypothetical protein